MDLSQSSHMRQSEANWPTKSQRLCLETGLSSSDDGFLSSGKYCGSASIYAMAVPFLIISDSVFKNRPTIRR
jgi:hypothetical protein